MHADSQCNAMTSAACAADSACVWNANESPQCSLSDTNDATWNAAVASSNTDAGTVALRQKATACTNTQSQCNADTTGWCMWGEELIGSTPACTVKVEKFYTDLCRSSATYTPSPARALGTSTTILAVGAAVFLLN